MPVRVGQIRRRLVAGENMLAEFECYFSYSSDIVGPQTTTLFEVTLPPPLRYDKKGKLSQIGNIYICRMSNENLAKFLCPSLYLSILC